MAEPFDGLAIACQRIAEETQAQTGFLDLGGLGLTTLPASLFRMRHLRTLNLGSGIRHTDGGYYEAIQLSQGDAKPNKVAAELGRLRDIPGLTTLSLTNAQVDDLTPLVGFLALQSLDCDGTQVADLTPLASLTALQFLTCSTTPISDLAPLSGLGALQVLNCSGTHVSDLTPLSGLTALHVLNCSGTPVSDLTPLSGLAALRSLSCSNTQISDLTPLSGLAALEGLACSNTRLSDLTPLAGLTALQWLYCASTQVSDLTPLADLMLLRSLSCFYTQISDLAPLAGHAALQSLSCWRTQVADLTPLISCNELEIIDCDHCPVTILPEQVWSLPKLETLKLYRCPIQGIPAEVLSQRLDENCLAAIRSHFRDLDMGSEDMIDVKLIVLGNGRVGKTQICRRLRGESYDSDEPSTHGILVTSASLVDGRKPTRLNVWDFGGQDLYHGTHALFLRTNAVFMLVWATETENAQEHEYHGTIFRNQPLPYWLAYVRHLAGTASPVLIVQTRCDRPQDDALRPPLSDTDVLGFEFHPVLQYSALNDRKRDGLDGALREAVAWLREHQGIAQVGVGRMRVQRALQEMRDADAAVPPEQRQYRTITQEHFQILCDEAGNVSSSRELLRYLHNAGIVFYRQGLFQDSIVLDQGWALDAIYAVFNREQCWSELKRLRGRFTRPLLELLVWGKHSVPEQRLFLDMMQSCGICFTHRHGSHRDDSATEYIAPELLPERNVVQEDLDALWDANQPAETAEFEFEMLHPGLVRGLICEIGGQAGVAALYWSGGVCAYETATRSHALIEQDLQDAWHGHIRVQTQGGQARLLLDRLSAWIEKRSGRGGLRAARIGAGATSAVDADEAERAAGKSEAGTLPGTFGPTPVAATEYFVSYAWGDDTSPEGHEREVFVDRLCAGAETRGVHIIRDKTVLRMGDSITQFMRRIGAGNRVFVILSEKYLRSPYCMFELLEIWRYSRGDEADFRRRVRIYALPDARAASPIERIRLAAHWKREHDEIAALIKEHGGEIVGTQDFQRFNLMGKFYRDVPDILATMFDTVQPRSFEELVQHGFDDVAPS